jgi:23S rRNA (pseudouridine1915-N3)-methyltransferase
MRVVILAVGKIKENYYRQALQEYAKRLGRYCKLELMEVADEKAPDGASEAEERLIKEREGMRLLRYVKDSDYVIALDIQGAQLDSLALAKRIQRLGVEGKSNLVFVVGGSLGLHERVLARANEGLSFSKLTFPHQLMRVLVLEQIYRSFRIIQNETYHK